MDEDKQFKIAIKERFEQLPKVVQDAITSADIEKHLRELANTQKLHLDQWQILENQVMLTLLGIEPIEKLTENIQNEVGVSTEIAKSLTENVSKIVFEPIREELERQLEHPDAKAANVSDVETARTQVLGSETKSAMPSVLPATPPAPPLTEKAVRAPISEAYRAGEPSSARKAVEEDPYREPVA